MDLRLPLGRLPRSVLDVETTGLWAEQGHRVCEIAVVRAEPGHAPVTFQSFVQPGRPIDEDARRVNGISDDDLAGAPRFGDLIDTIDSLLEDSVLVAHNAPFDAAFLMAEYAIADRVPPDVPVLDTLALSRRFLGSRRHDLGSVAEALGVPFGTRHRALDDALTTLGVLERMCDLLASSGPATASELLTAQGRMAGLRMPALEGLPDPLIAAVHGRQPVTICYIDAGGNATERTVEPLWANHTYLIAWCRSQKAQRTFRLDRIVDAWLS